MITFPEHAKVGRIVAKERFYSGIDTATKNLFQNEIARIVWEYKLAPNTINLPAKKWPEEIEVFRVSIKNSEVPEKVLKAIDSAIPYPILFLIEKGTIEKAIICHKSQNQKDQNSAKVDTYFDTGWNDDKLASVKIDGLSINAVYENFLRQVAGDRLRSNDDGGPGDSTRADGIGDAIDKMKERERLVKQIESLTKKIKSEPSLGKKQELATERYRLQSILKTL